MIRAETTSAACSACGVKQPQGCVAVIIGEVAIVLCKECGNKAESTIHNKLWQLERDVPTCDELTSEQVASFTTYPHDLLLDELVMCTVRWNIGPLDADERRIATALLERLATLGIACKKHRAGCEVWPKYRLCTCPWEVPS
jgi:hypothetical protein